MNDEQLVHLVGYAAIVAVLASASWAGPVGMLFGALFVVGALLVLGRELFDYLTQRLRAEAEAAANQTKATATDGGESK